MKFNPLRSKKIKVPKSSKIKTPGERIPTDKNESAEYTSEAVWERNLQNLECGALGDKESPLTLLHYWQAQEKAHYPHARENVEYFSDIVKTIKEKEGQKNESEL